MVKKKGAMGRIEISCVEVWREVSNYLDADISPELRERMEAHFKVCAHCSAVLDGMQNVVGLVADGRLFQTPEGFNKRLYSKINPHR
ncbi:MAG: zf-HC2 domain-containing protein [Candidatus Acidiferrales bacterium]